MHRWAVLALLVCGACSDKPTPTPGEIRDLSYPRIASYRVGVPLDDAARSMLERIPLAIVDAGAASLGPGDVEELAAIRARKPSLQLLASVPAVAFSHDTVADATLAAVPSAAWVVEPGSTTVGGTSESDTRIRVADPAAFAVNRPASPYHGADEPTYLLVEDEHVKLVSIEGDELVVERGAHSIAATHPAGARIAAHVALGPGTWLVDVTLPAWRDFLTSALSTLVTAGPWSGVFLDRCLVDVVAATAGTFDLDRDGVADDAAAASAAWQAGFAALVDQLRGVVGADAGISALAANGACSAEELDGVLLDGFPVGPTTADATFGDDFDRYLGWTALTRTTTPLSVAAAYSPAIGLGTILPGQDEMAQTDYAAMRFGLATALLGDGFFAFDNGPLGRSVSWWYDEYDGAGLGAGWLGHPLGPATRVTGGIYIRMFTRGMVIANPTPTPLMVTVPPGHRKLDGSQDPAHDDGQPVDGTVLVGAHDGYLLAR
jgi:hypothetical protein